MLDEGRWSETILSFWCKFKLFIINKSSMIILYINLCIRFDCKILYYLKKYKIFIVLKNWFFDYI